MLALTPTLLVAGVIAGALYPRAFGVCLCGWLLGMFAAPYISLAWALILGYIYP